MTMNYIRNRVCSCTRCRAHSLMGAAVLITLGVLFLLDKNTHFHFHQSFPILLLVIGGVLWFRAAAPRKVTSILRGTRRKCLRRIRSSGPQARLRRSLRPAKMIRR
jgi:hypothetical protein